VRALGTVLSTVTLLCGFVQAPFFHIHPEDLDHPATPMPVHMHVHSMAPASGAVLGGETADDDAVDVEWGIARASVASVSFAPGNPESIFALELTLVSTAIPAPRQRGHDPPEVTPQQSRAPPA